MNDIKNGDMRTEDSVYEAKLQQKQEYIYQIKKSTFLNWYFKYKNEQKVFADMMIEKLKARGIAQITTQELLDSYEEIPRNLVEGYVGPDAFQRNIIQTKDCKLIE